MPISPVDLRPGPPAGRPAPSSSPGEEGVLFGPQGLRAGWGLLLFVVAFTVCFLGVLSLLSHTQLLPTRSRAIPAKFTLINDGIGAVLVIALTWAMSRLEGRLLASYGFAARRGAPLLLYGLLSGLVLLVALVGLLLAFGLLHLDGRLLPPSAALRSGLVWAGAFVLVALFEELLMRGYLQATLARGLTTLFRLAGAPAEESLGFWTAALLLSLLFGASHHGNPGESPLGLVSATCAGLVFCFSLWRTGSLWWAIGFHATWDWAQSFLFGVADSGNLSEGRLFASHPIGRPILSGGLTGPEGSVLVLPVLALSCLAVLLTSAKARIPQDGQPAVQSAAGSDA